MQHREYPTALSSDGAETMSESIASTMSLSNRSSNEAARGTTISDAVSSIIAVHNLITGATSPSADASVNSGSTTSDTNNSDNLTQYSSSPGSRKESSDTSVTGTYVVLNMVHIVDAQAAPPAFEEVTAAVGTQLVDDNAGPYPEQLDI